MINQAVMRQLPNVISLFRLTAVPVLLALAWFGYPRAFLALLVVSFASDVLDGLGARRVGLTAARGAGLDTGGDFAIYCTIPLAGWWLWPEILRREAIYFAMAIGSFLLPTAVALVKFRRPSSYHTWAVKIAALLVGGSVIVLFAGGPAWPFRVACPISVLAGLEEIAITLVLTKRRSNVRSLWHVLRATR